jgi:hypothetical protein
MMVIQKSATTAHDVAERVLHELIECYFAGTDFYMNDRMDKYFHNNEEAAFITNEEIIDNMKKKLTDKYYLQVDQVKRTIMTLGLKESFDYMDTKLEIKLKEDDD